tara:strand:+ start:7563 stop:7760 length:198 start_codon:yes stop_codon:yes gene_type:complete
MKLSEYIFKEYNKGASALSEEDIEKWIIEWYNESFKEIGCDGTIPKARMPPSWLADWRKHNDNIT